jgi:FkbM family methyltransferase
MLAPLDDFVGRSLYYFGDLDPKLTWICRALLRPGDTVLDVGANLGLVTLIARALVGETGCVHAFEPQPDLAELVRRSALENRFREIRVHAVALGRAAATLNLFVPLGNRGAASLTRIHSEIGSSIEVPVVDTSEYLEALELGAIRLLKMDVEGHEEHVLRGGARFFERNKPHAIISELNDAPGRLDQHPVVRALQELDYELWKIPRALTRPRIEPIDGTSDSLSHDILAIARGESHAQVLRSLSRGA